MTRQGSDYLAAIRGDGRRMLLDGEPVDDVTTHPGFAGPARVIASLYDGAIDRADLAYEMDGARHSAMWLVPRSSDDLAAQATGPSPLGGGQLRADGPDARPCRVARHRVRGDARGVRSRREPLRRQRRRVPSPGARDRLVHRLRHQPAAGRSLEAGPPPARAVPVPGHRGGTRRRHRRPRGADDRRPRPRSPTTSS